MNAPSPHSEAQPDSFAFTEASLAAARQILGRYPDGRQRSALLPLLDLVQRQEGWVSLPAMRVVGEMLGLPEIQVYEVATFYTMLNLKPVGRYHLQVCTNLPCMLRGSQEIIDTCRNELGIGLGETTADGKFTLSEVECLGACVNAPVMWVGDDYYEDLGVETTKELIGAFRRGETPRPGSQTGRTGSAPLGGPTTLTTVGSNEEG